MKQVFSSVKMNDIDPWYVDERRRLGSYNAKPKAKEWKGKMKLKLNLTVEAETAKDLKIACEKLLHGIDDGVVACRVCEPEYKGTMTVNDKAIISIPKPQNQYVV
jgi:hypothetical protein